MLVRNKENDPIEQDQIIFDEGEIALSLIKTAWVF